LRHFQYSLAHSTNPVRRTIHDKEGIPEPPEFGEAAMLMIFEVLTPKDLENNDISGFNAFNFEF
jgi:hypothetical protein